MTDNLYYYNAGRAVPPEAQKSFNNGKFSGTDINPMWRIKKLTELFGPAGIGWYTKVTSERCEEHGESDTIAIVDLELYIKVGDEWSKPIYGTGGNVIKRVNKYQKIDVSDEGYKMAYTDALSVACKALGIGADIYFASDRTKYSAAQESREKEEREKRIATSASPPRNDGGPHPSAAPTLSPRGKAAKAEAASGNFSARSSSPPAGDEDVPFMFTDADAPPEKKEPEIACADCGKIITGRGKHSAEDMAKRTVNAFGYPLCYECGIARQKKINAENAGGNT